MPGALYPHSFSRGTKLILTTAGPQQTLLQLFSVSSFLPPLPRWLSPSFPQQPPPTHCPSAGLSLAGSSWRPLTPWVLPYLLSHGPSICRCLGPCGCLCLSLLFVSAISDMRLPTSSFLCLPVTFFWGGRPPQIPAFPAPVWSRPAMAATHGAILSAQAFN